MESDASIKAYSFASSVVRDLDRSRLSHNTSQDRFEKPLEAFSPPSEPGHPIHPQ